MVSALWRDLFLSRMEKMSNVDDWLAEHKRNKAEREKKENAPDWTRHCANCNETPVVKSTGLCGPCTFGEADTAGGNW
jgi:hypothetical protein